MISIKYNQNNGHNLTLELPLPISFKISYSSLLSDTYGSIGTTNDSEGACIIENGLTSNSIYLNWNIVADQYLFNFSIGS